MSETSTNDPDVDDPETTTINVRVTERQLAEIDAAWKEGGYTSRSDFLRHAIRDATEHPGRVTRYAGEYRRRGVRDAQG
ncbi:ribbon-helix-helix domain-containing protein [Halorubrum sp. SD690R]|uniref:ribbon-helix-helix domain-containing protein n=1 Tax=Halorubrum sp. SD690R TaxID=2518117 RepID=UPI001F546C49|nr:ribbon-helix-helix domain-containing protein [Halorubrum sp. SD690R]